MNSWVLDTNVVISAVLAGGSGGSPPRQLLAGAEAGRIRLRLSDDLLAEYAEVLTRPRFLALHKLSQAEVRELLARLALGAEWVEVQFSGIVSPDPKDQHVVDLVLAAPNAVLVTGDHALRVAVGPHATALTPREALAELRL